MRKSKNEIDYEFIDAEMLQHYLMRCGKVMKLEEIKDMMSEIEQFNGQERI